MLLRTVRTFQRATRSARQHGYVHGFRSQPRPLLTITRSLHDDSDIPPSSQEASHDPSHTSFSQSWSVDKINMLQTDMATNKMQLNHLKESMDTQISNLQNSLESSIARPISALESRINSKFDILEFKMNSKLDILQKDMNSKFDTLQKDIKHIIVEFKGESAKNMAELKTEMGKHEVRLIWRMFFAVLGISALTVGGAVTTFLRDRLPPQQTSRREEMKQDDDKSLLFLPQRTPHVEKN